MLKLQYYFERDYCFNSKKKKILGNFSVLSDIRNEDYWGSRGPTFLYKVPGVPSVSQRTLLRSHVGAPSVVGVCCPLLDPVSPTISYAGRNMLHTTLKYKGNNCL